jgi:hypothetical protein
MFAKLFELNSSSPRKAKFALSRLVVLLFSNTVRVPDIEAYECAGSLSGLY